MNKPLPAAYGALLTVAYAVSGKLGLMLAQPPGYISAVFPAAGLALAACYVAGYRTLSWIFIGSMLLNLWVGSSLTPTATLAALGIAAASALQAGLGGWAFRRALGADAAFDTGAQIGRYLLLAPLVCLVSATLSVAYLSGLGVLDPASPGLRWFTWWIGDTLGVATAFPLSMLFLGRPAALWKKRRLPVAVTLLLSLTIVVALYLKSSDIEARETQQTFLFQAKQVADLVQHRFNEQTYLLDQIDSYLSLQTNRPASREAFAQFVSGSLHRFPMIQAIEWAPRVRQQDRERFETAQKTVLPDFEIHERNTAGTIITAAPRTEYFPVTYIEPLKGNRKAVGFDLASNPERREAVLQALSSHTAIATVPVKLVQEKGKQTGILLLRRVSSGPSSPGLVLTVLRAGDFVSAAMPGGLNISLTLIDAQAGKIVYESSPRPTSPATFERILRFGGRDYRLQTAPTPSYLAAHQGMQSWGVLVGGLVGTGLLGGLLLLLTGSASRVESLIVEKTRQLAQESEKNRALLLNGSDGIHILDLKGNVIEASDAFCRMLGYPRDEVIGMNVARWDSMFDPAELAPIIRQQYANQARIQFETVHRRCDGSTIDVEISGYPLKLGDQPLMFYSSRDITERKHAERMLQDTTERLNEAQQISKIGSWELDFATGKLVWSDEIFHLFEIDPYRFDATYEAFLDAVHPDDREAVNKAYTDSLTNQQPYEIRHRLRMKDNRIKWILEHCSSEFDAAGRPIRSIGTCQDITREIEVEEQLRVAAAAFESQQSMIITDAKGTILRVNSAFTDLTGYSAGEVLGRNPSMLQSGRHDETFYREMWDTVARAGSWHGEIWDRHKSGEILPRWMTLTAVKDAMGRVTHYVSSQVDIAERKAAEEAIRHLAFYDPLTRLPNRRLLLDRLQHALATSARTQRHGALLFIDMDNFKALNDTLGHEKGDQFLKQVAERLQQNLREGDTVARLGGDEFVIVLEALSKVRSEAAEQTERLGEKLLRSLNQTYEIGENEHPSTASIGATLFDHTHVAEDELMKQADLAMYQAKAAGKNTLRFFDPEMQTRISEYVILETELRKAIDENQLLLHYQALIDANGRISGAEALVRWQHPRRGLVPPAEFIPFAEQTGLILPLGQWVLEAGCAQLAAWAMNEETAHLSLAINISGRQLQQPDFTERVRDALHVSGADPRKLKLELTEGLFMENVEDTIAKMATLSAMGVQFALDDFGTGYSSLSYLKRLPLKTLKIDRSFIKDVLEDPNDAAIARMVIALAEQLGLTVIAEGVELEGQRDFLARHGCHGYQGYLFSRPVPLDQFEALARQ
jgi:diguanylate cyclase (GGDEF)-like protein/PAS domain S-box-containing protein